MKYSSTAFAAIFDFEKVSFDMATKTDVQFNSDARDALLKAMPD